MFRLSLTTAAWVAALLAWAPAATLAQAPAQPHVLLVALDDLND